MNIEKQYLELLRDILENGTKKEDRTGTGTLSIFGRQIRHKMSEGFPLLTTKKMYWKGIVTELLWFLRGDTNIKFLVDNNCHIWDGDAYKAYLKQFEVDPNNFNSEELAKGHNDQCWGYPLLENTSKEYKKGQINAYLEGKADKPFFYLKKEEFINKIKTDDEFSEKWGDLGPIYGRQWRFWKSEAKQVLRGDGSYRLRYEAIDQIQNLINDLKTNPDSRRLMVTAWQPAEISDMVLPPCHYGFQVYTRELNEGERGLLLLPYGLDPLTKEGRDRLWKEYNLPTRAISLMWNQRSVDTPLGLPFNIASYGLLLEIIAKMVNMVPDELIGNLGDVHIYNNQIEGVKEQLNREQFELPKININTEFWPTEGGECGIGQIDATAVLNSFYSNDFCKSLIEEDIQISNYKHQPAIKFPLSN